MIPLDQAALGDLYSALSRLQTEQETSPCRERAVVITNLETTVLWLEHHIKKLEEKQKSSD